MPGDGRYPGCGHEEARSRLTLSNTSLARNDSGLLRVAIRRPIRPLKLDSLPRPDDNPSAIGQLENGLPRMPVTSLQTLGRNVNPDPRFVAKRAPSFCVIGIAKKNIPSSIVSCSAFKLLTQDLLVVSRNRLNYISDALCLVFGPTSFGDRATATKNKIGVVSRRSAARCFFHSVAIDLSKSYTAFYIDATMPFSTKDFA